MYKNKKIVAISLMLLVLVIQSLSNWIYFVTGEDDGNEAGLARNVAEAAGPKEENKLVAIFVEQNLYNEIGGKINRYTVDYIQDRFPRTKALVLPVDTSTIAPKDIQKILSNLYHGGEKDVPSTLIGTILIGNIPLPTIQTSTNGEVQTQKSILPYTDLEKPTFEYNNATETFTKMSTHVDSEQELFHGLIIFNSVGEYNDYFDKLKKYTEEPEKFATKKMWYDDFIQLQKNYTESNSPIYAKKQIFDEDLLYHRYTPALFNLIAKDSNEDALNILSEKIDIPKPTPTNETTPLFSAEEKAYNDALEKWQDNLAKQADENKDKLKEVAQGENIPTLVMGQSILEQLKNYPDIFAPEYGDIIFNQMGKGAGRWTGVDIANNVTKISAFDEISSEFVYNINDFFEKTLDAKISGEAMSLDVPLPLFSEYYPCDEKTILCSSCDPSIYSCEKKTGISLEGAIAVLGGPITAAALAAGGGLCTTKKLNDKDAAPTTYETFYFGKNALDITGAEQTTRFRGTYGNITGALQALNLPWSKDNLAIGATFGFNDQQVLASRGYNMMKAQGDGDLLNALAGGDDSKKTACTKKLKKVAKKSEDGGIVEFYAKYYWGGNSALNLTGSGPMYLASDLWQIAYNPSTNRLVGGALFDIAGSTMAPITGANYTGGNAQAVDYFANMRATTVWNKNIFDRIPIVGSFVSDIVSSISDITGLFEKQLKKNEKEIDWCNDDENKYPIIPVKEKGLDYFSAINKPNTDVQVVKQELSGGNIVYKDQPTCKTRIIYKTIPSIIKHISPTPEEVKAMNITTQARGIDTKRYVSFKGIAGNIINLYYPNLYDVPVYELSGSVRLLENTTGIKENIRSYLQDVVKEQNKILIAENQKITAYYATNVTGFKLLEKTNPLASPLNRTYKPIPEDTYTKLMDDETLTKLADMLYIKNSPRGSKIAQNTVAKSIDQSISTMHIESKIQNIMHRNLVLGEKGIGVNTTGYELAYIRSAGSDAISSTTSVPSFIQDAITKIDQRKAKNLTDGKGSKTDIQKQVLDVVCGASSDGTVPLLQWPKALTCRRKNIQTNVKEGKVIEIGYKNALGPVYPLNQFGAKLKESYTDYIAYVTGVLNPQLGIEPANQDEAIAFGEQAKLDAFTVGSMKVDTPTQKVIRGSIIPISISAKNKNGDVLENLYNPVHINIDKGFFPEASTDILTSTQVDITDPGQPIFIDTTDVNGGSTINVIAEGGDGVTGNLEILVVDATLRVLVNNAQTNEATIRLPDTSYTNTVLGKPVLLESRLPSLTLILTDQNAKPIRSLAQITSDKGLIQPCKILTGENGKQCMEESLWDVDGEATIRLLPSMKAGKDTIRINISGLPERTISFTMLPASPYRVTVAENTGKRIPESEHVAALELFDVRNNKIIEPVSVTYNLVGEATDMQDKTGGNLQITDGKGLLPIKFGKQGGANYIYAEIGGGETIPGYMRWDTYMKLWPEKDLNVVYLTLLGDDRGNQDTTKIPKMITDSKKLLAVTTSLENPTNTDPVDLEPLRSYGGGKTVGESRRMQFDPSIINYGDPMLQHADANKPVKNDTTSVRIGGNKDKTITKVVEFDIDNDGRKDMLILYDDDTLEFMKQYGGTPAYRKLGNLMSVVDGVANLRVGDVNNDSYPDIFVKTKRETLRVYTNKSGVFPTNGVPICLNVPTGTTSTRGIWDLEVADMNNDGNMDVITNDTRGQITIFYGGNTGKGGFYVSNNDAGCDPNWYERQEKNNLVVASFGLGLQERVNIYDDSLLHWGGLSFPPDDGNINIPAELQKLLLPSKEKPENFKLEELMKIGAKEIVRYSASPYDTLPYGEAMGSLDSIAYIASRNIIPDDPAYTYKTYTTSKEGKVIVTVTIGARMPVNITYIEQLLGPWKIQRGGNYDIIGFNSGSIVGLQTALNGVTKDMGTSPFVNWNPGNPGNGYQFMIDNLRLQAGQKVSFSYPIEFTPAQIARIKVEDKNEDGRLDISTTSLDQCVKTQLSYISVFGKSYSTMVENDEKVTPAEVGSGVESEGGEIQEKAKNGLLESIDGLSDVIEKWDSSKTRAQNIKDTKALENGFSFNESFELSEEVFGEKINGVINDAEKIATNIFQGACKGFVSGGGTKGLPVPFNVALLAPGDINVFGCKVFHDYGIPIFAAPTTPSALVPFWPPSPTNAGGRFGQSASISQIRIYVAPTLTLSVGVAICLGPYALGKALPSPLSAMGGNCIVFAKRPGGTAGIEESIDELDGTTENSIGKACRTPYPDPDKPVSPIVFGSTNGGGISQKLNWDDYNPIKSDWRAATQQDLNPGSTFQGGTYLGILDLDIGPEVENNVFEDTNQDQLKGGKPVQLKIQTGKSSGLLKCIVQKRLDNQIRYVANNLTNMSINITIPDPSNIFDGFKNIDFGGLEKVTDSFEKTSAGPSPAGSALKNLTTISSGEWPSQSDVTDLSALTSNPFNALSSWFEQVPMIRLNTKNVTIQIPFIYEEELSKFMAQVEAYSGKLEAATKEWEKGINDLIGKCGNYSNELEREACNKTLEKHVQTKNNIKKLQTDVKRLIQTLEAYKRFPGSLKQWVTVNERYMTELTNTLQGVSTDLTSWLNTNASIFSSYVDSIITMIGAVKSWQPIIKFSTDRTSKCGKCTVDTYDYYSCSLSLLCPKLPILAIPPFKIPNIYIDLSNINIGLDVLIPNIRFVPRRIELPDLPDIAMIPMPGGNVSAEFNVNLKIPTLPAPPTLPELPSFIPSIDLNLPTLPPAPKIPNLAPSIKATLKVMSKIGNILCMVKNIKLVGEKDVKTKIEQLTQRTWSVEPFDSLLTTKITPPLRGFDVKISTYVNFELNFDGLYDIINDLTKKVNEKTKVVTDRVGKQNTKLEEDLNGPNSLIEGLDINPTLELKGSVGKNSESTNKSIITNLFKNKEMLTKLASNPLKEPELVDPAEFRLKLQSEISSFKQSEFGQEYKKDVDMIQGILDLNTKVTPDYASIQKASDTLQGIIRGKKNEMTELKNQLNDYDSFLDKTNTAALISQDSVEGSISVRLYKADEKTKYIMDNAEHPTESYLNLEDSLANGYSQALKNHTPEEMNMKPFTHSRLVAFFDKTTEDIKTAKKIISPAIQQEKANKIIAVDNRLDKLSDGQFGTTVMPNRESIPLQKDGTTFKEVFITDDKPITNLGDIDNDGGDVRGNADGNNNDNAGFQRTRGTRSSGTIWRDEHNVYTNQTTRVSQKNDGTRFSRSYTFKPIKYYRELLEAADRNGFVSVYNSAFNLADRSPVITSLEAVGQANNTASIQWANTKQQVYILSLENRIIDNHELDKEKKYIIAYVEGIDLTKVYLDIDGLPKKKLSDIQPNDNIKLLTIAPESDTIALTLDLPEKIRSYIQIAHCMLIPRENMDGSRLERSSAWSHQETLGSQKRGDTAGPNVTVRVIDKKTNEVVSTGTTARLPRKGEYDIAISWKDEESVIQNSWNKENDDKIYTKDGGENMIQNIPIQEGATPLLYEISAFDQANNTTRETIKIVFIDPRISIVAAPKIAGGFNVDSEISMLYPDAYVRFYAIRNGMEFLLTGRNGSQIQTDFPTHSLETAVIGGLFGDADTITLVDEKNEDLVKIDKKTGKISPCSGRDKSYSIRLEISNNVPVLLIIDSKTGKTLFTIYIKAKNIVDAKSLNPDYPLIDIPDNFPGTFAGGQCLQDKDNPKLDSCALYLTKEGNMFIPEANQVRFGGTYNYNGGVEYTLTLDGKNVLKSVFTPEEMK